MFSNIIRALRLPFITVSALPFILGSLVKKENFNLAGFCFGFFAVIATHLSANLINDYADSKSGADWQDKHFYKFFGGSKLIQENIFSPGFYLKLALFFAFISALCVILLAINLRSLSVIGFYIIIIALSWAYSAKPLEFSYRRIGEFFIFLLFGPALVMGGYFIQAGIFPDSKSFLLSVPFGLLTTAILFANEVPDYPEDKKAGKNSWVSICRANNAYLVYYLLMFLAFFFIYLDISLGYLKPLALFSFILIFAAIKAANILKKYPEDKIKLMQSSKLTILIQTMVSIVLILAVIV